MKIFRTLTILSCLALCSCESLLDITQDNQLSQSNMWQDANDVITSTNGIYYRIRENFCQDKINIFYWGDVRVGSYMWGKSLHNNVHDNDMSQVLTSRMNANNTSCAWAELYTAIDQSNLVLKYADQVKMSEAEKGFCVGQAVFARAYLYFWAARMWGDVPLNLNPIEGTNQPETYPVRTPKAQVYAQIGKDIALAAENAQYLGKNKYFATAEAVWMLQAEYALWMYRNQSGGDSYLDLAKSALSHLDIKASSLNDNYADSFDRTNKASKEIVFALYNDQGEKHLNGFYWTFYCANADVKPEFKQNPVPMNQTQWWMYSENFKDILLAQEAKGDRRASKNLGHGPYHVNGGQLYWINKYLGDQSVGVTQLDCDIPYYRYALAIMMDAEAKYYSKDYSGALASLNIIAKRAYGKDNYYTDTTPTAVLQAITDEYFYEFPAEGVIWWALIRLDKIWDYNDYLKSMRESNPNILLWPISASARNKNGKLTQTEGWS